MNETERDQDSERATRTSPRFRVPRLLQTHKARLIIATVASTAFLGVLFVRLGPNFRDVFDFLLENLPLTLPVLTVVLSVATRPHELRTLPGLLNTANYFALGLVTFAIWAFVAAQSATQYILVGQKTVLNKDYALLLLLGAFTWAGFSAVVTALAEGSAEDRRRPWQYLQCVLVAVSFVLLLSPFFLFEPKERVEKETGISFDEVDYTVSIAFQDPALDQHLGRSTDPLKQCQVYRSVAARSRREALTKALELFRGSEQSKQFVPANRRSTNGTEREVQLIESWFVAEPTEVRNRR